MKGLKNIDTYVDGVGVIKTDLAFENGIIKSLSGGVTSEIAKFDDNAVVVPGFIDEHIHGANNFDTMDGDEESIKGIAKAVAGEGTTSFLATTMTQSVENISKSLSSVANYISSNSPEGAEVLGVHLEGPFISPKCVGAQNPEFVELPSVEIFKKYQEISSNNIKILSIAPEVNGAEDLIKYAKDNGVICSIAHTKASYEDCQKAIKWGASGITHTYNAQTGLHHRDVGVVGTALLNDEVYTEIICDTIHVSVPAIKLLLKNKPKDKICLITDSMRAKYLSDGESELGGQVVIVKNGEARLTDGTLAGSVLKMNVAVKNLVQQLGVNFTDAIDFASKNPAQNLGVYDKLGSIKVGKRADFVVLDKNSFEVLLTVRNGEIIYQK